MSTRLNEVYEYFIIIKSYLVTSLFCSNYTRTNKTCLCQIQFFIIEYSQNKIYQKMQRAELYIILMEVYFSSFAKK